ncbi:MAG: glucose-6-phosphate isomerase [Gammaproteobacteria bacterium]|nr:glucose-6-phosphate isomerase [Gammaproteobacteria bacterium]
MQSFLAREELLLDYSKNLLDAETRSLLIRLAEERQLKQAIRAMFAGEIINKTEQRPAHHVALRLPEELQTNSEVSATLRKMSALVEKIHTGDWTGHTGRQIETVINIGIGGSDLGPAMVVEALRSECLPSLTVQFVSNVDPIHMQQMLERSNPETTLFIVASKSFTTAETLANANYARRWLLKSGCAADCLNRHFVAVSSNVNSALAFGIAEENIYPMWDWVGGRYSLWSAIGLPIALAIFAVVPYSQSLDKLPDFLQQLSMESLGKRVTRDGEPLPVNSGAVIWGTPGTNGQHSYFQLLHQGTSVIPVDFIAVANSNADDAAEQHEQLLANCLAQSLALMEGRENSAEPHRSSPGSRPSNTLILKALSPSALGSLLALFEHQVFVQSVIWDINAFDQWGVELGKTLAKEMLQALGDEAERADLDASSQGLIAQLKRWQGTA